MPSWTRGMSFQDGQRFAVLRDVSAKAVVSGLTPLLSVVQRVVIRSGEVLTVLGDQPDASERVSFRPHRYEVLEQELVDPETRAHPGYRGYALVIDLLLVESKCAFIGEGS
jgi:hypothetical protein